MVADCDTVKLNAIRPAILDLTSPHMNQRKIRGAAADVADQDLLPRSNSRFPIVSVLVDPGVERSLRLLDQDNAWEPRPGSCFDRQLASNFIKRGRQRQDDVLLSERLARKSRIPSIAKMLQIP